jgi:alanine-synthesizing transaminase
MIVIRPKAGMFDWTKIPAPYDKIGSMSFAIQLMEQGNVAVAPGIGFAEEGEGYLRLVLVENEQRIQQALRQIKQVLGELNESRQEPLDHELADGKGMRL